MFLGKKANVNVEYIQNIGELYTPLVSEKSYATWKERIKNLGNDAEGRQKLSRDKMISRHGNIFPPSVNELAESIRIRGKHKTFYIIKGKINNRKDTR